MLKRTDLGGGAWIAHNPTWLSPSEASEHFDTLLTELPWTERSINARGKQVLQPRLITWAGQLPYLYSGQVLEPLPMHPLLDQLSQRLQTQFDLPFNHVVANLYRNGQDRVGFHADDEPELGYEPLIVSVSLGVTRRFVLRQKYRKRRKSLALKHGSLLVMGGTCQHRWYHAITGDISITQPRINLTYRYLRGEPGWRAPRQEDPRQQRR